MATRQDAKRDRPLSGTLKDITDTLKRIDGDLSVLTHISYCSVGMLDWRP